MRLSLFINIYDGLPVSFHSYSISAYYTASGVVQHVIPYHISYSLAEKKSKTQEGQSSWRVATKRTQLLQRGHGGFAETTLGTERISCLKVASKPWSKTVVDTRTHMNILFDLFHWYEWIAKNVCSFVRIPNELNGIPVSKMIPESIPCPEEIVPVWDCRVPWGTRRVWYIYIYLPTFTPNKCPKWYGWYEHYCLLYCLFCFRNFNWKL